MPAIRTVVVAVWVGVACVSIISIRRLPFVVTDFVASPLDAVELLLAASNVDTPKFNSSASRDAVPDDVTSGVDDAMTSSSSAVSGLSTRTSRDPDILPPRRNMAVEWSRGNSDVTVLSGHHFRWSLM